MTFQIPRMHQVIQTPVGTFGTEYCYEVTLKVQTV